MGGGPYSHPTTLALDRTIESSTCLAEGHNKAEVDMEPRTSCFSIVNFFLPGYGKRTHLSLQLGFNLWFSR